MKNNPNRGFFFLKTLENLWFPHMLAVSKGSFVGLLWRSAFVFPVRDSRSGLLNNFTFVVKYGNAMGGGE